MKKAFVKLAKVFFLFVFAFGLFHLFDAVQVVAARGPEHNLSIERCAPEYENEVRTFFGEVSGLLEEALRISRRAMSYEEAAQRYLGLAALLHNSSYPECAQPLYDTINESMENEAKAHAALAQGGIFSHLRYWYYHSLSARGIYLSLYIIKMINPLPTLQNQYHA